MTREEALKILKYRSGWNLSIRDVTALNMAIEALESCYNPDEWCHDCKEYNHDKHCCPRYTKVIRNAVKEMKEPKIGHWITTRTFMHDGEYYCDKCKCDSPNNEKWDYCPNCGAKMKEAEDGNK